MSATAPGAARQTPVPWRGVKVGARRALRRRLLGLAAAIACASAMAEPARPELDAAVRLLLERANAFRSVSSQPPLATDAPLVAAATEFARYMARTDRYGHEADGRAPAERAQAHGYDYCVVLENIAFGQSSAGFRTTELADGFFNGWRESPGHRRNLLDPDVTQTGIAIAQSASTHRFYAVQMFGRPKSMALVFSIANESEAPVRYTLGGKTFDLRSGETRRHQHCRSEPLAFSAPVSGSGAAEVRPVNGQTFVVSGRRGGALQVDAR